MPDDDAKTIDYTVTHVVEDNGIEIGFIGSYTDPGTDEERTFVADTYTEAERMIRADIVRRYGFDAIVTEDSP